MVLSCTDSNDAGAASAAGTATATVFFPPDINLDINAPNSVTAGKTYAASVVSPRTGSHYTWLVDNSAALIISNAGASIQFNSGAADQRVLSVKETNGAGTPGTAVTRTVFVFEAAAVPSISAPAAVTTDHPFLASVTPRNNSMNYTWSNPATGETAVGSSVTLHAPSPVGQFTINVTESNNVGDSSATGSVTISALAPLA